MTGPEIVAVVAGVGSCIVALITAGGTIWYNWRRSKVEVRSQQFTELNETVQSLGERLTAIRAELKETRGELRAAEREIVKLKTENASLRARVGELEAENRDLRGKLQGSGSA